MPHTETTLSSQEIFNGKVIRVTYDTVRLENGDTSFREVVHHHGGACVLAVTPQDEIYLVKQFRYAMGEEIWELPAGKLEAGEDPFEAAKRELAEECGVLAARGTGLPEASLPALSTRPSGMTAKRSTSGPPRIFRQPASTLTPMSSWT